MATQLNKNGENIGITWCDATVNLWWGCSKVHTGCKNCYAEYLSDVRYKKNLWGENTKRRRIVSAFTDLDNYQKEAAAQNKKLKIFVGSMMDIFEGSKLLLNPIGEYTATEDLRLELFSRIFAGKYDNLVFLLLTKRPENLWGRVNHNFSFKNIWLGTSISDQETADEYVKNLQDFKTFCAPQSSPNLFLSIEPQVGPIDTINLQGIGWVIQGGESGVKKRPFDIAWAEKIKEMCQQQQVPYFFKQIDKKQPIPEHLQIREFPEF